MAMAMPTLAWIVKSTEDVRGVRRGEQYYDGGICYFPPEENDPVETVEEYPILSVEFAPKPDTLDVWFESWFAPKEKGLLRVGTRAIDIFNLKRLCREAFYSCFDYLFKDDPFKDEQHPDEDHWVDTFMGW